jgi:hypothetical protein
VAFSDHWAHLVTFTLPAPVARLLSPRARPIFKIKPEVIRDAQFRAQLATSMERWRAVRERGIGLMAWWELLVKPGVRQLAIERGRELARERRGALNFLFLQQSFHARRLQAGEMHHLQGLRTVQLKIVKWYEEESAKIILQSRSDECSEGERVRVYHHELHQKKIRRSSILKLETERGVLLGHADCAAFLETEVEKLLLTPNPLDQSAWDELLADTPVVFTDSDNAQLMAEPTEVEVREVLTAANLLAAPGTDGIPALLYRDCWDVLGGPVVEMVQTVFAGAKPSASQRSQLMVFGSKPKKIGSFKPQDKRRISLLNSDYKLMTGLQALRFGRTATHSLSPLQLVAGADRRMQHAVSRARDAIQAVAGTRAGCGLLDADFEAGFDWLVMCYVYAVLLKKGCHPAVIDRLKNLYSDCNTKCVVNDCIGKSIPNVRGSLRQGDIPSMYWFAVALDPLLYRLERLLTGIPVFSITPAGPEPGPPDVLGPPPRAALLPAPPPLPGAPRRGRPPRATTAQLARGQPAALQPLEERYKVYAYADDVKCGVTTMDEFRVVIESCSLLERAGGVKLHRNVASGKVRFLPLGRWRGTLQQEDLPYQFIRLSDSLDFLGVILCANYVRTRKANCDEIESRVKNVIGPWRGGKFMEVTKRGHSVNAYAYSKIFHRCATIPLRTGSVTCVTSQARAWVLQDFFLKPAALVLCRQPGDGGLGLQSVECRALAMLLRNFCELACTPGFRRSLYLETLWRTQVLGEFCPVEPRLPPYYSAEFFAILRHFHLHSPFSVPNMRVGDWYRVLLEDRVTHSAATLAAAGALLPVRTEVLHPAVDWPRAWRLARLPGLPADLTSHLFRQLHGLLSLQSEICRIPGASRGARAEGVCRLCEPDSLEDLNHAYFTCENNREAGGALLAAAQRLAAPGLTGQAAIFLELQLPALYELATVYLLSAGFCFIWDMRCAKKGVSCSQLRAELLARCNVMAGSKFASVAEQLRDTCLQIPP